MKPDTAPIIEQQTLASSEVSHDRKLHLAKSVNTFLSAYETSEGQTLAMTRFSMPLNQIMKQPEAEKFRTVQTSNTLLKPVVNNKKEVAEQFLQDIGFQKQKDMVFKYMAPGNLKEVEMVVEMMKERVNTGKVAALTEGQQEPQIAEVVQSEGLPADVSVRAED